jgi:hypothetical protein
LREQAGKLSGEYSLLRLPPNPNHGSQVCSDKKGAWSYFLIRMFSAPALPLEEVFDPTGAETFAGGFAGT